MGVIRSELIVSGLGEMLGVEARIGGFARAAREVVGHAGVREVLDEIAAQSELHQESLRMRLATLEGPEAGVLEVGFRGDPELTGSEALRRLFALVAEAVAGYAVLQPMSSRFRDGAITAPAGMTGHITRDHLQDYVAKMGTIAGMLGEVVLFELKERGLECQCTCPACGVGLCVCGLGGRAMLNEAWLAARPEPTSGFAKLAAPRGTSAVAQAGLIAGDIIEAVDGADLASYPQLQTTIKGHEFGEVIKLSVRRGAAVQVVDVRRFADLDDSGELPLDCEAPSGQVFYLDRARDVQQRLRRRSGVDKGPGGLASLSTREVQVLRLLTDGSTNPVIAEKLRISRPTVARHVANILMKLDVTNRAEAAAIAATSGLASDG